MQLPSHPLLAPWGTESSLAAPPVPGHLTESKIQQAPRQGEREREHELALVRKGPSGRLADPRQFPRSKPGLALRPGHVAWLTRCSSLGA